MNIRPSIFYNTCFLLFLTGFSAWLAADNTLTNADIRKLLTDAMPGKANFIQHKFIDILPKPLVSEGYYYLETSRANSDTETNASRNNNTAAEETALHWVTEKPIANQIIFTQSGIYQSQDKQLLSSQQNNEATQFVGRILTALLTADLNTLNRYFKVTVLSNNLSAWQLQLQPMDPAMLTVIQSIQLQGGKFLEEIQIQEKGNNRTEIFLTPRPAPLS